jgi:hypothetical protein
MLLLHLLHSIDLLTHFIWLKREWSTKPNRFEGSCRADCIGITEETIEDGYWARAFKDSNDYTCIHVQGDEWTIEGDTLHLRTRDDIPDDDTRIPVWCNYELVVLSELLWQELDK